MPYITIILEMRKKNYYNLDIDYWHSVYTIILYIRLSSNSTIMIKCEKKNLKFESKLTTDIFM